MGDPVATPPELGTTGELVGVAAELVAPRRPHVALVYDGHMVFHAKHFELEISKFFYLRAPRLGVIYIGRDSGHGCIVRYSPQRLDLDLLKYLEMARQSSPEAKEQLICVERPHICNLRLRSLLLKTVLSSQCSIPKRASNP